MCAVVRSTTRLLTQRKIRKLEVAVDVFACLLWLSLCFWRIGAANATRTRLPNCNIVNRACLQHAIGHAIARPRPRSYCRARAFLICCASARVDSIRSTAAFKNHAGPARAPSRSREALMCLLALFRHRHICATCAE